MQKIGKEPCVARSFSAPAEMWELIDKFSRDNHQSASETIRQLIGLIEYLQNNGAGHVRVLKK